MLCTPRTLPIFEGSEYLDDVMRFELTGARGIGEFATSGLPALVRTLRRLRARHFDVVVDFDNAGKA